MAAKKAVVKLLIEAFSIKEKPKLKTKALITKEKIPKVKIVIGKAINFKIGLIKAFNNPITTAKAKTVFICSILIPENK